MVRLEGVSGTGEGEGMHPSPLVGADLIREALWPEGVDEGAVRQHVGPMAAGVGVH